MFWTWVIFGALIGALAAQRKGLGMVTGVLGGMVLGLLSPLMFLLTPERRRCPACAEMIQRKASLCPHCRTEVTPVA